MEIDSPSPDFISLPPRECIVQRLVELGVPKEQLDHSQHGLVVFVKENKSRISELVSAILPTNEEVVEAVARAKAGSRKSDSCLKVRFRESMIWLQWLMFEGDPGVALNFLAERSVGERGVCGAVWGSDDIAYRCRTCEHDPTCAICVPCFQNGDHKDHDYSIIYTGSGCCDCGDATAWKREGFCLKHKGAEQIQPLPENIANCVGPVIDALLHCWKNKLLFTESVYQENPGESDHDSELREAANEMTFVIVEMLLEFCKQSESLLSFVSWKVSSFVGLLDILVSAERFLDEVVTMKLHEALLKLLGEPIFKYEFAKVFLNYYPIVVDEAIKRCSDTVHKNYPLLSTFSVQLFTVPTLTPRLVKEMNLLGMLLGCLEDILLSCAGEDGRLQVNKLTHLYETTLRVVEDTRFVMSHVEVPKYITHDQRGNSKTWMRLLAFVQGVDPQKRETGFLIEEENENTPLPFVLGHSIANIHSHWADVLFSVSNSKETDDGTLLNTYTQDLDDGDGLRHAKVGRLSQAISACSETGRNVALPWASKATEVTSESVCHLPVPSSVTWLTLECLRAIENWLRVDNTSGALLNVLSPKTSSVSGSGFLALKKTFSRIGKGKYMFSKLRNSSDVSERRHQSLLRSRLRTSVDLESGQLVGQSSKSMTSREVGLNDGSVTEALNDCLMEGERAIESEPLLVLSLSDWPDIIYDVSSQNISVHIPLHRLLSLLLQKALRQCFGESAIQNVSDCSSVNPTSAIHCDFFGHVLGGCHPYGFSAFIMEHPLRIRVFCAEVHAGMWRKNGDAAILSSEWYQLRWPDQGLELDLFLLQCCAALAPVDLYVNRILERFGLSNYLSLNLERSSEYEPALLQEMLTLLIQIVKERRFCGLTPAECLKRELIYKLVIGDATHSQLVKSLPRDLSKSDQLHAILDNIAEYSHPSSIKQGMYSLQWTFWKELDLYHPRWNPRDLQVAEERYLRFCSASALTTQLPRWTKIYPPLNGVARVATCKVVLQIIRAVLFYAVFTDKSNASRAPDGVLLTALHLLSLALDICSMQRESGDRSCYAGDSIPMLAFAGEDISGEGNNMWGEQSLLSLLVLLMRMHKKEDLGSFMEAGNCNISSFVGSLLKKFAEIDSGCMLRLQKLAPEVVNDSSQSVTGSDANISDSEKRRAKARERQTAIMEKMKAEQSKFLESIDCTEDDGLNDSKSGHDGCHSTVELESEKSAQDFCSLCHDQNSKNHVSLLILLQKSRVMSFVDKGPPSWDKSRRLGKKKVPIPTSKVVDQFGRNTCSSTSEIIHPPQSVELVENTVNKLACDEQPSEVDAFLKFIRARFPTVWSSRQPCKSNDARDSTAYSYKTLEEDIFSAIRRNILNSTSNLELVEDDRTKLYAKEGPRNQDAEFSLLGKYVSVRSKMEIPLSSEGAPSHNERTPSESTAYPPPYDGYGPSDCDGIHLSSCGHAVHQECLDRYLTSLKERYNRRIVFEGGHIVDPDRGEFLCPLCRRLANSILPALPTGSQKAGKGKIISALSSSYADGHLDTLNTEISFPYVRQALALLKSAANMVGKSEVLQALPMHKTRRIKRNLEPILGVLFGMYFPGKMDMVARSANVSHSSIMWDTLRYSLISTEIAARSGRTYMTPTYSLDSLYKELRESGAFVLSLLLKIVQSSRHKDPTQVLQRFSGLQLFTASICYGMSIDNFIGSTSERGVNMPNTLEHVEEDIPYPDIQFLKRTSGPILARDPFSSLMWILFCLPRPFLSCEESFLSLVHIFYVVSVAQSIITYCTKFQCKTSEIGFQDSMIADISKVMDSVPQHYFASNYIDPSCDINDVIRSLCFPYLRRCVLLSKLVRDFTSAPFCDGAQVLERSSYFINDMMDFTCSNKACLSDVENLENMFKIPSLDVVLKDEMLRSLVLKWLHHLCSEFEAQSLQGVLYCTPAVPFKLMHLPDLYQDVLQRYIKQHCPDCKAILDEPALCLLCGRLCSPSWNLCCRKNRCKTHAMACGAGTGVFLLIKKTTILLQRSARQAPWPSLYLDAFGEEDVEMHRGKPLYLNKERYAALSFLVASHGLDQSSKVLRQTTIGFPLMD